MQVVDFICWRSSWGPIRLWLWLTHEIQISLYLTHPVLVLLDELLQVLLSFNYQLHPHVKLNLVLWVLHLICNLNLLQDGRVFKDLWPGSTVILLGSLQITLWLLIRSKDSSCSRPKNALVKHHALRTECLLYHLLLLLSERRISASNWRVSWLVVTSREAIRPDPQAWLSTPTLLIKLVVNRETEFTEFITVLEAWG